MIKRDYSNWVTLYEIQSPQGWRSRVMLDRVRTPQEMRELHWYHCKQLCEAMNLAEATWSPSPERAEQARALSPDGTLPWWWCEESVTYRRGEESPPKPREEEPS